jgi:CubicO group peptidase (beta-lactamase class C family)
LINKLLREFILFLKNIPVKKSILLGLILFFIIGSCSQQENHLPTAKPEKVGMSSERLNRIKPVMQKYIDENKLPGIITMVARHGKVVHFEKYGMMDADKPMQLNTIFSLQSMTKPITSVAAMMLYEEGLFQLDDPVSKYIPEFKDLKVFSSKDKDGIHVVDQIKPMTIRNLLTHTSGLTYGMYDINGNTPVDSMYNAVKWNSGTLSEMIQKLVKIPLANQPGTKWNYSVSTDVLGYLVEVISGKPLNEFFKERIFIPLKMEDTDFYVPKEKINRLAALYGPSDNKGIKVIIKPDSARFSRPAKFLGGGGRLYSTATDYMIFAQMLLNKGEYNGIRLLGSKTVELMTKNQIPAELLPVADWYLPGLGFGLGFSVMSDPLGILGSQGEYGWAGAYNTYFSIDPTEDLIWIQMTQFYPTFYYPVSKEFKVLVYQAIVD